MSPFKYRLEACLVKVVINAPLLRWRWVKSGRAQPDRGCTVLDLSSVSWGSSSRGICGVLQPGAQLRMMFSKNWNWRFVVASLGPHVSKSPRACGRRPRCQDQHERRCMTSYPTDKYIRGPGHSDCLTSVIMYSVGRDNSGQHQDHQESFGSALHQMNGQDATMRRRPWQKQPEG